MSNYHMKKLNETIANLSVKLAEAAYNNALDQAHDIALAIDSGRGNEKEIAKAIKALKK